MSGAGYKQALYQQAGKRTVTGPRWNSPGNSPVE